MNDPFLAAASNAVGWVTVTVLLADLLIRIGLSVRVIMRRLPVGVAMAWLVIILLFPFGGAVVYLLIGELRLGSRRAERAARSPVTHARARVRLLPLGLPASGNGKEELCQRAAPLDRHHVGAARDREPVVRGERRLELA